MINLSDIIDQSIKPSKRTVEFEEIIMRKLDWFKNRYHFAMCCIGVSISTPTQTYITNDDYDSGGKEIPLSTLFQDYKHLLICYFSNLFFAQYSKHPESSDVINLIKAHWNRGAELLKEQYSSSLESEIEFARFICGKIKKSGNKSSGLTPDRIISDIALSIHIGVNNGEDVMLELNNTEKHANSHLAIMGKPGVGKTQFLLNILANIRKQSNYQTNFIFFDYKGDVVDNNKFITLTRSKTYSLLSDGNVLPINPFVLPNYDENTIILSAREKAESFSNINAKIGVVQKGVLSDKIREAYLLRSTSDLKFPDFNELYNIVKNSYEDENKKDDSLIEILKDLSQFNLFWHHGCNEKLISSCVEDSFIVDLHKMPVLKEIVATLIIEKIYKEMTVLPDSPIINGHRFIRTIIVIDEAHNYLGQKNLFLEKIIREGRSKGIAVFFASQSPNDYQQKFFNFQELLEFAYIFQCDGVSSNSIQDILGCPSKSAKDLSTDLSKLRVHEVVGKINDDKLDFIKFDAVKFYETFK